MTSTAPWWATGVFTLGGVVVAQLVTYALSRSRSKFEDSRRWHEDRRDIYLDVVTNAWRIQDAVFDYCERGESLPDDLESTAKNLEAASVKTQLVGSEEVTKVARKLVVEGANAVAFAQSGNSGKALDACDNLRHTLYYLVDLMRAELTSKQGGCEVLAPSPATSAPWPTAGRQSVVPWP